MSQDDGAGFTVPADAGEQLLLDVRGDLKKQHAPVLLVVSGAQAGHRIVLSHTVTIGRDPMATLSLAGDRLASFRHARIEDRGDAWALVDVGSRNGTRVDGRKVSEEILAAGATIEIGGTRIRFELQDAELQRYGELVDRLLSVDDLSGLFVRRHFDEQLQRLVEAARLQDEPLCLLVMDLDGIKAINDAHGHLFGAYTIAETGHLIGRLIAGRGIGCRFGGDEYIVALPATSAAAGEALGREILAGVGSHHYEREGLRLYPGISIGVAAFPTDADSPEELFQRADEAMYRAKQGGRNQVCR